MMADLRPAHALPDSIAEADWKTAGDPSSPERDRFVESPTPSDEVEEEKKEQAKIEIATGTPDNSTVDQLKETAGDQPLTVHLHDSKFLNTGV